MINAVIQASGYHDLNPTREQRLQDRQVAFGAQMSYMQHNRAGWIDAMLCPQRVLLRGIYWMKAI